jgi:hypothetical protein
MNLLELFRRLSYGEFSNLKLGASGVGTIVEDDHPKLVNHINEALLRLHSRFLLRENMLFLQMQEHLTYYYLLKRYARSQLTDPPCPETPHLYIMDNVNEPFQEDVIKVLQVIDQDGCVLPLNDAENTYSLYTPQPNLLQIPAPVEDRALAITYQARHPLLAHGDLCQEIDLPFVLEGALQAYVAAKIFRHMNGQENNAQSAEHMAMYESVCTEVEEMDLVSQTNFQTPVKFDRRGWK